MRGGTDGRAGGAGAGRRASDCVLNCDGAAPPPVGRRSGLGLGRRAPGRGSRGPRSRALGGGFVFSTLGRTRPGRETGARFAFKASRIRASCNSPELSHFAAFFLERRAEVSVVKSRVAPPRGGEACFPNPSPAWACLRGPGPRVDATSRPFADFHASRGFFAAPARPPGEGGRGGRENRRALMIHLQVHLQIPCYDFFFL